MPALPPPLQEWVVLGCVDLDEYAEANLVEVADWELNLRMIKGAARDLERLPAEVGLLACCCDADGAACRADRPALLCITTSCTLGGIVTTCQLKAPWPRLLCVGHAVVALCSFSCSCLHCASHHALTVAVALQVRLECYRVSLVPVKEAAEELMKKLKAALGASLRRKVRARLTSCTEPQQP